ncbi:lipoprotein [Streptomyces glaucus]|uniref:Lipoprotein n=1 Tax=Streptomyces glaucus TaxID=284029 RepID=A0ABP5X7D7_9ACTN
MSVLSLALVTGCSGSGPDDSKDSGNSGAASAALGAAELKKLIIADGDVKGYEVRSADTAEPFAGSKDAMTVTDAACEPIAYVLTGFAPGDDESAYVNQSVAEKPDAQAGPGLDENSSDAEFEEALEAIEDSLSSTVTIVSLSSYEGDGAEAAMKSVSSAVDGCAGGFTAAAKGQDTQEFTKVAEEKSSGTGDESVAFAVTGRAEGGGTTAVHAEVVRHGTTVATYYSLNLAALAGEKPAYTIPAEVMQAQAAKLG